MTKPFLLFQLLFAYCILFQFACDTEQSANHQESNKQTGPRPAADESPVFIYPGDYYKMKIGVKGNHLSAVFFDENAKNPEACQLLFEGLVGNDNPIKVTAYNPQFPAISVPGTFLISGNAIIVQLENNPKDNCTQEFTDGVGVAAVLADEANWSAVRMVEHQTDLYEDFGGGISQPVTLTKGTVVAILEKRQNWYRIQVQNSTKDLGWVEEYMLYPQIIKK